MNLFFMGFKALVKFTPTQKDDEALAKIEKFLEENPELRSWGLNFLTRLFQSKQ